MVLSTHRSCRIPLFAWRDQSQPAWKDNGDVGSSNLHICLVGEGFFCLFVFCFDCVSWTLRG